jgi:ABC-2 type transport system ATP-binding protein
MIELINVSKAYGNKEAVKNISLKVDKGELFTFLGPNGAGKTTTIKMLCGLLKPSAGTLKVGGFDIQQEGDKARQILSYVPDLPYLYEKLTGREFMQFIITMYGMDPQAGKQRMEEMIELFELDGFVDDLSESYSHGMRQRTVFASALLHQPEVLIVDEPMVGLDPKNQRLVKDLLRDQVKKGVTVFMSIHTLDIAQELATRIAIINHGRIVGEGTLDELRNKAEHGGQLEDVFLKLTTEPEAVAA